MERWKKAVIVGLGDVVWGDLGAGSYVIEALSQENLGMNVSLADLGSEVLDLEVHLYQKDYAVLAYALARGCPGGHISQYAYQEALRFGPGFFCGGMRPVYEALFLAKRCGVLPPAVTLVVIEPQVVRYGLVLSGKVRRAIRKAARLIKKDLERRGFMSSPPAASPLRYRLDLLQVTI